MRPEHLGRKLPRNGIGRWTGISIMKSKQPPKRETGRIELFLTLMARSSSFRCTWP